MPRFSAHSLVFKAALLSALMPALAVPVGAQELPQDAGSKQLAPGFQSRAPGSKLVIAPADMEMFSISAGGVQEPRADWTEAAQKHFQAALEARRSQLGADTRVLDEAVIDELAELKWDPLESTCRHASLSIL